MKISNSVGTGFPESKFYIFEEHRSRGFQHGMSLSPPIFFLLIQLWGTCDQLKSGHMPIVCILRFFYLAQYFGRERGRRKKCNKKENAQFCFSLADRLRWSVYRVLLQVAHFVIRFLGPFLSSDESNHASNLPVPSLYLHSPLCLHFRLLALLRCPSL